jgi:hypothetical protein
MRTVIQTVQSPTAFKKVEHCSFAGVPFHLPKKESRLLESDYVELCPKTFQQCIQGFHSPSPDYQFFANSIYKGKEDFCRQSMKLNRIHRTYNHTLQQKLSATTDFIWFEALFKYIKESPHKQYGKKTSYANFQPKIPHSFNSNQYLAGLLDIIQSCSDKHQN